MAKRRWTNPFWPNWKAFPKLLQGLMTFPSSCTSWGWELIPLFISRSCIIFIHPSGVARLFSNHHDTVGMFLLEASTSFLLPDFVIPKRNIQVFQPNHFWGGKFATSWVGSGSVFVRCAKLFVGSWELANWFKYVQKVDKLGFNPVHGTCKPNWGIWKWL